MTVVVNVVVDHKLAAVITAVVDHNLAAAIIAVVTMVAALVMVDSAEASEEALAVGGSGSY